ncbi:MAG: hypothetical protein PWP72_112 [Thermoanaerobacter sp.]|nr:hypothetical protein [Thermoanaerobacter sp.]
MLFRNLPGPVKLALAILAWALILWIFTLGYPAFRPLARLSFGVLILPCAVVEWMKMKGLVQGRATIVLRTALIALAAVIWLLAGSQLKLD